MSEGLKELKTKSPWAVDNLDEYLFYCCPQCEHQSKSKPLFIDHAFKSHPEAKDQIKDSLAAKLKHLLPMDRSSGEQPVENDSDVDVKDELYVDEEIEGGPISTKTKESSDNAHFENDNSPSKKLNLLKKSFIERNLKVEIFKVEPGVDTFPGNDVDDEDDHCGMCLRDVKNSQKRPVIKKKRKVEPDVDYFIPNHGDPPLEDNRDALKQKNIAISSKNLQNSQIIPCKIPLTKKKIKATSICVASDDVNGPFQCYRCGDIFETSRGVKLHLSKVHFKCSSASYGKPRDFQCIICKKMVESEEALSVHDCQMLTAPLERRGDRTCKICDIQFPSIGHLSSHNLNFHLLEKKFACDQCDFKTKVPKYLTTHIKRIHQQVKNNALCMLCGKVFVSKNVMLNHVESVHGSGEKKYVCDKCGVAFTSKFYLSKHQNDKHKDYNLCTLCDKMFPANNTSVDLRLHLAHEHQIHCGLKDFYTCWKCQKGCNSVKELDDHMIKEHEMRKNEELCQICDVKSFAAKQTLKIHVMESHDLDLTKASNPPFIMELFNVMKDTRIKTGPKKGIPCPACSKKFGAKTTMERHYEQAHNKESHVKCKECDFTACQRVVRKHYLHNHDRTTKYDCDQCSYFAFHPSHLRNHKKRVHEKIKAFPCSNCDAGFNHKSSFANHLLKAHNVVYQFK